MVVHLRYRRVPEVIKYIDVHIIHDYTSHKLTISAAIPSTKEVVAVDGGLECAAAQAQNTQLATPRISPGSGIHGFILLDPLELCPY